MGKGTDAILIHTPMSNKPNLTTNEEPRPSPVEPFSKHGVSSDEGETPIVPPAKRESGLTANLTAREATTIQIALRDYRRIIGRQNQISGVPDDDGDMDEIGLFDLHQIDILIRKFEVSP